MFYRRLRIFTSAIRHRTLISMPCFSTEFIPKLEFSRVFSSSPYFHIANESSTVETSRDRFFSSSLGFLSKNLCSKSVNRGVNKCWNCDAVATSTVFLACESCRSVQPVDPSVDYFRIFGLDKGYGIRADNLEGKYKDWQKKLHPDLVHSKSEKERAYAAEQSARVIDAYRTLGKPLTRAIYLLKLEGIHVDEEQTISEPLLLAEILEIREAVEEAVDPQALNQIQTQIQEKLEHWSKSFGNAFQSRQFEDALNSIRRMTYYDRVNEVIVKKL